MTKRISYSGITLLVSVCVMLLSGCSNSDDVTPPASPTAVSSKFFADNFTLTIDGESVQGNRTGILAFNNNVIPDTAAYTYDMLLSVDKLYDLGFVNTPYGIIQNDRPVLNLTNKQLPVKVFGDADNLTIEGDVSTQGMRYIITGKIENLSSESERHMYVNIDKQLAEDVGIAGTYEIQFDQTSLFTNVNACSIYKTVDVFNTTLNYMDCAPEFRNRANKAFVENSGYEGARIALNPDCTMEVYFKDANTKEYVKAEGEFSYIVQDGYIIFICDYYLAFQIKEWRQLTDNPLEDLFSEKQYGYSIGDKYYSVYALDSLLKREYLAFRHLNELTYLLSWTAAPGADEISDMFKAHEFLTGCVESPYYCNYRILARRINDDTN